MSSIELNIEKYKPKTKLDSLLKQLLGKRKGTEVFFKSSKFYIKSDTSMDLLTWENVKTKYPEFLRDYNMLRKSIVDYILAQVATELDCNRKCIAVSTGSVTSTSDYDITVSGPKSHLIVNRFNEIFRTLFNEESGTIFDTNIYGTGFYHLIPITNYNCKPFCPKGIYYINFDNYYPDDIVMQRIFALCKFNLHKSNLNKLDFKLGSISNNNYKLDSVLVERLLNKNKLKMSKMKNIEWMNKQYESKLFNLVDTRRNFENKDSNFSKEAFNYKTKISETNLFANESYFTQGAFLHVVGNIQAGMGFDISIYEYIDSVIENSGDIIKEVNLFAGLYRDDAQVNFLLHVSKYVIRLLDATTNVYKKALNDTSSNKSTLVKRKLLQESIEINEYYEKIFNDFRTAKKKNKKPKEIRALVERFYKLITKHSNILSHTVLDLSSFILEVFITRFFDYLYSSKYYITSEEVEKYVLNQKTSFENVPVIVNEVRQSISRRGSKSGSYIQDNVLTSTELNESFKLKNKGTLETIEGSLMDITNAPKPIKKGKNKSTGDLLTERLTFGTPIKKMLKSESSGSIISLTGSD